MSRTDNEGGQQSHEYGQMQLHLCSLEHAHMWAALCAVLIGRLEIVLAGPYASVLCLKNLNTRFQCHPDFKP